MDLPISPFDDMIPCPENKVYYNQEGSIITKGLLQLETQKQVYCSQRGLRLPEQHREAFGFQNSI